jgi:hypothetical protein
MKLFRSAPLILLGSASATTRLLQGENGTAITTDGDIEILMNTTAATDPIIPIDLVASTATPTDAAGSLSITTVSASEVPADTTAQSATLPAVSTVASLPDLTTTSNTAVDSPLINSTDSSSTANSDGITLTFNNGDQNILDSTKLTDNTDIQVANSSTLFITTDSISITGYCDNNCVYPNATIDSYGSSNVILRGDDISIYGSSQDSDGGGGAIELREESKGMMDGSILIQGGEGGETGGDALGLYDESFVEISGDVVLVGGGGAEAGKSLTVDTGSTAKINSGTFKNVAWVENGSIDVFGGVFEEGVTLNGNGSLATFYGCFSTSVEDGEVTRLVELSGTFDNATSADVQTISVSVLDGAVLKTDGGSDCVGTTITTEAGNSTFVDDDAANYVGNATSYVPTYMPTTFEEQNSGCIKSFHSMIILGLIFSQHIFI